MRGLVRWYHGLDTPLRLAVIAAASLIAIVIIFGLWMITGPGPLAFANGPKVALTDYHGPDPTGVPASLKKASLLTRGAFLANVADCVVCHTAEGGKPYAGGFAFTLPFGTIYSTNLTPDKETGIGNYSDREFLNAVQHGIRRDGAHLYPAMPYTSYTFMTDADALAIKAYLFSLAPIHAPATSASLVFPFNQRWLMGIWNAFFNPDTRFKPDTSQSPAWNRGAYIAEALAHCGDCHTPRNLAYALDNRSKFAGTAIQGWRAYNITSDKTAGVGAWSDDALFDYLIVGHATGHGTAAGPMGESVDQRAGWVASEDIRALVAYLRTVPPIATSSLPAPRDVPAPVSPKEGAPIADARGKQVFEEACVSCHGWTGVSPILTYATLTGARAVNDPTAMNVAQAILHGVKRQTPSGPVVMPGFGDAYSNIEIAAVANYVTARFGATPARVTAADISRLRSQGTAP